MFSLRHFTVAIVLSTISVGSVSSVRAEAPLPLAKTPEEVGLSSAQFKRIESVSQAHVDAGILPGAHMLVVRKGKIAWQARLGHRDRDAKDAMPEDAIFRIYSMTKPITSVAAMMLVEEGRLQVYEPVTKYLPEIGAMKVGTEKPSGEGKPTLELADPARPMTVQDLLRHTSGLTYGDFGSSLVHMAYKEAKIGDRNQSNAQFVSALSKMPLRFSPGTRWEYGRSTDVLGRLVEVIEGKSLGEVLAARIFAPLGMTDTAFHVPSEKLKRVAQPRMEPFFDVAQKFAFEGGGEGLTATMEDYLKFTLMLANNGAWNSKRLLGKQTVSYMTADHLGTIPGFAPGRGFGLGFAVRTKTGEAGVPGSVGEYSWAGYAGTLFWVDPKEDLIAIYMAQVKPSDRDMLRNQFWSMVQAAIVN
jgi:CubicO group peptidase (beta-lactamase class C family)